MIEAYPLYWPEGWKKTDYWRRKKSRFNTGFAAGRDFLLAEIKRLGGKNVVLSTNVSLRRDGLPYASEKEPQDPGAAVYFTYKEKQMCFACDRYKYVKENIYAIGKTIEAIRAIERWGASDMMERAFRGFTALPSESSDHWSSVLGISRGATKDQINTAWRNLAIKFHPDHGGTVAQMSHINTARDEALREVQI